MSVLNRLRGNWLEVDLKAGVVRLPRFGVEFQRNKVLRIDYIDAWHGDYFQRQRCAEFQLVVANDDGEDRWVFFGGAADFLNFHKLAEKIGETCSLPVICISETVPRGLFNIQPIEPRQIRYSLRSMFVLTTFCAVGGLYMSWFGWARGQYLCYGFLVLFLSWLRLEWYWGLEPGWKRAGILGLFVTAGMLFLFYFSNLFSRLI